MKVVERVSVPAIAVTVTIELVFLKPLAHPPISRVPLMKINPTVRPFSLECRRLLAPNQNIRATVMPESRSERSLLPSITRPVVIVNVVDSAAPPGASDDGAKLHVAPRGRPEQANEVVWLKLFIGFRAMVTVPL